MKLQNSITIHALRTNENISVVFDNNGKPLFQAFEEHSGIAAPDWTEPSKQPSLTPKVVTTSGDSTDSDSGVKLTDHSWIYNGSTLVFGTAVDGWVTESGDNPRFKMEESTGTIKIIKNLASLTNQANDSLAYGGVFHYQGNEITVTKEATIQIVQGGATSYYLTLVTSNQVLSEDEDSAVLSTQLFSGISEKTDYTVKWYKGSEQLENQSGKNLSINRSTVDGTAIFYAEAVIGGQVVARAGIHIQDVADEYKVDAYISSANVIVAENKPVTVSCVVKKQKDGTVYTGDINSYLWKVFAGNHPVPLKTATTATIDITTDETDVVTNGIKITRNVVAEITADI